MRKDTEERARLEQEIAKRPSSRSQLPEHVRRAAIVYTQRRVSQGASQAMIARELGVTTISVARWIRIGRPTDASSVSTPSKQVRRLRAVRIVDSPRSSASTIVATTRDGLRVEGLTVADLVTLLRALA